MITAANGREFAGHETIAKALEADMYFVLPYLSWASERMRTVF